MLYLLTWFLPVAVAAGWTSPAPDYSVYIPSRPSGALLLFLHGCNESPEEFAGGARIAQAAEARGYHVLLPRQDASRNPERCWNWFLPFNQVRGTGEAGHLAEITAAAAAKYRTSRVFVAGLSAGGAMAATLASCYPDLFAAAAIHSGLGYRAAYDVPTALWSIAHGSVVPPRVAGWFGYQCGGGRGHRMPLITIQGTEDARVAPINQDQLLEGFATLGDWMDDGRLNGSVSLAGFRRETPPANRDGDHTYTVDRWPIFTRVVVNGMAHAWSGGDPAFPRTDARGPDFTAMMLDFFEGASRHAND